MPLTLLWRLSFSRLLYHRNPARQLASHRPWRQLMIWHARSQPLLYLCLRHHWLRHRYCLRHPRSGVKLLLQQAGFVIYHCFSQTDVYIFGWNSVSLSFSVQFSGHFSRWTCISRYQNVSILDIIGANDDDESGGDNQIYNTCKAPVKSSPPPNQHPTFLQAGYPSCHPTNSVEALNGNLDEILWGNSAGG